MRGKRGTRPDGAEPGAVLAPAWVDGRHVGHPNWASDFSERFAHPREARATRRTRRHDRARPSPADPCLQRIEVADKRSQIAKLSASSTTDSYKHGSPRAVVIMEYTMAGTKRPPSLGGIRSVDRCFVRVWLSRIPGEFHIVDLDCRPRTHAFSWWFTSRNGVCCVPLRVRLDRYRWYSFPAGDGRRGAG